MSAEHNHAPRCCCAKYYTAPYPLPESGGPCPACPEHGALACTCGSTYATYEGPERDCPTHGEAATPYTEQETTK